MAACLASLVHTCPHTLRRHFLHDITTKLDGQLQSCGRGAALLDGREDASNVGHGRWLLETMRTPAIIAAQ